MTTYVCEELELNEDVLDKLRDIALKHNATIDEVVNEILVDFISERTNVNQLVTLAMNNDTKTVTEEIRKHRIITDLNGTPIARITPIA